VSQEQNWVEAGEVGDIEEEDVIRFDYRERTFAIYRTAEDTYFATDGLCTHEKVHLSGGYVTGHIIECPKHNGRFDFTTGQVKKLPPCVNIQTYPVRVVSGKILLKVG
jgi:3-phenylpropionate/trans-cinnamate dioxygenase ferredoxin subunit